MDAVPTVQSDYIFLVEAINILSQGLHHPVWFFLFVFFHNNDRLAVHYRLVGKTCAVFYYDFFKMSGKLVNSYYVNSKSCEQISFSF